MSKTTIYAPKERPIIMSGPVVLKTIAGEKTQTRRVVKPRRNRRWEIHRGPHGRDAVYVDDNNDTTPMDCPYGEPGDTLWVRETHAVTGGAPDAYPSVHYRADMKYHDHDGVRVSPTGEVSNFAGQWKPSIFMRRTCCRLFLRVKSIRVERVQEITAGDILAEGVADSLADTLDLFTKWADLWDGINGKRPGCAWGANPFVWVVEYERIADYEREQAQ